MFRQRTAIFRDSTRTKGFMIYILLYYIKSICWLIYWIVWLNQICGALHHKVHHVHPLNVWLPQHRDWSSEF